MGRTSTAAQVTIALVVAIALTLAACTGRDADPPPSAPEPTLNAALRDELLAMQRDDQLERTGGDLPPGTPLPPSRDRTRAQRLQEIIAQHGWPSHALVGRDGGTAAWLVAQHADFDIAFQERAVALMTAAVGDGQADPTELAYLEDRVAVNRGRPQVYGTQVRCRGGVPEPATPLTDPGGVDAARASVGLGPLQGYHAELTLMCADEAADGLGSGPG